MTTAWDVSKEIARSKKILTRQQLGLVYKHELKRLFYDFTERCFEFDQRFLKKNTEELNSGLLHVLEQLKKAGFQATLTSETARLLATIEKAEGIMEDRNCADAGYGCRREYYIFHEKSRNKCSRVFNMTRKWVLTIDIPDGKKSLSVFAIMAFEHETACEDLKEPAHYSEPDAYMQFPRFVVYTAEQNGKYLQTTDDIKKIQYEVRKFVS